LLVANVLSSVILQVQDVICVLFQFSTQFKNHLNKVNLQLIEELTFNTDDQNIDLAVKALHVSTLR